MLRTASNTAVTRVLHPGLFNAAEGCDNCFVMHFRLLGPLEVWDRGRGVELRRPKQRALLAILLLRAREPVSSDALIDALWGESAPRTARAIDLAIGERSQGPIFLSADGGRLDRHGA